MLQITPVFSVLLLAPTMITEAQIIGTHPVKPLPTPGSVSAMCCRGLLAPFQTSFPRVELPSPMLSQTSSICLLAPPEFAGVKPEYLADYRFIHYSVPALVSLATSATVPAPAPSMSTVSASASDA